MPEALAILAVALFLGALCALGILVVGIGLLATMDDDDHND